MKLYDFLKAYEDKDKAKESLRIIIHPSEEEAFTIYADAYEFLDEETKEAVVKQWKVISGQKIEVWLEKAIPSG